MARRSDPPRLVRHSARGNRHHTMFIVYAFAIRYSSPKTSWKVFTSRHFIQLLHKRRAHLSCASKRLSILLNIVLVHYNMQLPHTPPSPYTHSNTLLLRGLRGRSESTLRAQFSQYALTLLRVIGKCDVALLVFAGERAAEEARHTWGQEEDLVYTKVRVDVLRK